MEVSNGIVKGPSEPEPYKQEKAMLVSKAAALNSQRHINVKRVLHEFRASPRRNSLWSMTLGPYSSHLAHELTYLHAGLPAGNKGPS